MKESRTAKIFKLSFMTLFLALFAVMLHIGKESPHYGAILKIEKYVLHAWVFTCIMEILFLVRERYSKITKGVLPEDRYMNQDDATRERMLKEAAAPLIQFINNHFHPHAKAIVTTTSVEILSGEAILTDIYDYVPD